MSSPFVPKPPSTSSANTSGNTRRSLHATPDYNKKPVPPITSSATSSARIKAFLYKVPVGNKGKKGKKGKKSAVVVNVPSNKIVSSTINSSNIVEGKRNRISAKNAGCVEIIGKPLDAKSSTLRPSHKGKTYRLTSLEIGGKSRKRIRKTRKNRV